MRESETAGFLHVVVDGQVEVFSTDRETTIAVLGPGHSFFVAAVILDKVCLESVRTLSPARVLLMPEEAVRRLFYADAACARAIALELAYAYRGIMKEFKNQKLRSTIERLEFPCVSTHSTLSDPAWDAGSDRKPDDLGLICRHRCPSLTVHKGASAPATMLLRCVLHEPADRGVDARQWLAALIARRSFGVSYDSLSCS